MGVDLFQDLLLSPLADKKYKLQIIQQMRLLFQNLTYKYKLKCCLFAVANPTLKKRMSKIMEIFRMRDSR